MAKTAVWSNSEDRTVSLLKRALEESGHEVVVIATGPRGTDGIDVEVDATGLKRLEVAGHDLRDLKTVFYRKPVPPRFDYEESQARFLGREVMQGIESALTLSKAQWVNHPAANRAASDKLGNLVRAQELGLRIPHTWAGDTSVRRATRSEAALVGKPVTHGLMERPDGASMMFATRLPPDFDESRIEAGVPMLLQEEVEAEADVRATVVGRTVLAAELPRAGSLDWRSSSVGKWAPCKLPEAIEKRLVALVASRSLVFGACDLLRSGPEHTFLELNPNGQWGWLESDANLPISRALAETVGGSL